VGVKGSFNMFKGGDRLAQSDIGGK